VSFPQKKAFAARRHATAAGALLGLLALLSAFSARSTEGVLLLGDDPLRVGRAGAAVAGEGNASWMMFNPAGLHGLDRRVEFGATVIHSVATLHTKGIAQIPFSGPMEDDAWNGFPSVGVVLPAEHGTFGLGLYIPAGAMVHFPRSRSWVGLFENLNDRNLEFAQPRLVLGYAHPFDSGWVLGMNLNGSLSLGRTDQITPRLAASRGDYKWDTALGAGFGLGVLRRWERWSFGASLQSRQWSQVFDKYRDISPRPVDLPATFQTGVGFKITPTLEVEMDYRFLNWSNVKFFNQPSAGAGMGWHDQHALMGGIEWTASPTWTFRAGYSHLTPAMGDDHLFGSALVPNVVTDHVGAGFTHALGEDSEISLALAHFFKGSQTGSGRGDFYARLGKGSESTLRVDWLSLVYTRRF
jgi:long-chain fatty acid transport protein